MPKTYQELEAENARHVERWKLVEPKFRALAEAASTLLAIHGGKKDVPMWEDLRRASVAADVLLANLPEAT